jgi:hypothetical protein
MITITKFPYRRRCELNLCAKVGVWSVGTENCPARLRQIFCEEHLIELGKAIALKFPEEFPTGNIAELEDKDRQIEELKQQLEAKTTAHECLKEQLAELKKGQEKKPAPPKNSSKTSTSSSSSSKSKGVKK